MKNFISAINHPESPQSGSTLESMMDKSKSLGLPYFAVTDNGYFNSVLKAYMYGKKKDIKIIAGVDAYFKDFNCEIAQNTPAENIKYYKVVLHAFDQPSYQKLAKICSDCTKKTVSIMDNEYALIDWNDLETLSKLNITVSTSDVEDIVTKNLLVNRPDIALKYYQKLSGLFGDRYYPSLITTPYSQTWNKLVRITTEGGTFDIPIRDRVEIQGESRSYARDLFNRFRSGKETFLTSVYVNKFKYPVKAEMQKVSDVKVLNDYQAISAGDLQLRANKFIQAVAKSSGNAGNLLVSNYSYYSNYDDKVVQNMRLIEDKQLHQHQHIQTSEEAFTYLSESIGLGLDEFNQVVENTHVWSDRFKDFNLKYDYQLADDEGDSQERLLDIIKRTGRMKWDNPAYVNQLKEEMVTLSQNGVKDLTPYFFPLEGVFEEYKKNKHLTGPGRGCLQGDVDVYTDTGVKKLKNIEIGDKVVTQDGTWKEVVNSMKYECSEDMVSVKTFYSPKPIPMTKDHKVLGIKRKKIGFNSKDRIWGNVDIKDLKWDRIDSFKIGDVLFCPWADREVKFFDRIDLLPLIDNKITQYDEDFIEICLGKSNQLSIHEISKKTGITRLWLSRLKRGSLVPSKIRLTTLSTLNKYLSNFGHDHKSWVSLDNTRKVKFKRYFEIDSEASYFIGRWIGDGWLAKKRKAGFGIAFNSEKEIDDVARFEKWLSDLGLPFSSYTSKTRKLTQVVCNLSVISNLFLILFPCYKYKSNTKYIGDFLKLKKDLLVQMFNGLVDSDGHRSKTKTSYDTVSFRLANEFRLLLNYLHIPSSMSTRKAHNTRGYDCKESYKVIFSTNFNNRITTSQENQVFENGYFCKIIGLDICKSDGFVYDITVTQNHNYLTTSFLVHNSSAGFLIAYLTGVTHVNPIKEKLSSSRFITVGRIKMGSIPDCDVDLPQRTTLVGADGNSGYLNKKYGEKVCQVSTRTLLRLKSSILDANRFLNNGEVTPYAATLSKSLPPTPQGLADKDFVFGYKTNEDVWVPGLVETNAPLQEYIKNNPTEWDIVSRSLSISRQVSRHASAYLLSNKPIKDTVPIFTIGGVKQVCQPEAKAAEFAGLIKYDFLVITSLQWIEDCLKYIAQNQKTDYDIGFFNKGNDKLFIWDLPNDELVWKDLSAGNTESVFQLNTASVTPTVMKAKPRCIQDAAVVTSLERPGPKDYIDPVTGRNMVQEYISRKDGHSVGDIEELNKLLPDTLGIICYQEDVTLIARELGKMNTEEAENLRIGMGKKQVKTVEKLKPVFIKGATETVGEAKAAKIWSMMETFSRYGFCKAHAVSYIYVSYACAFLKYHYPLEWWAAVLSNAEDKEINEVFYKYIKDIVLPPDINVSKEAIAVDYKIGKLRNKLSMISKLGSKVAEKIISLRPYDDILDFVRKNPCGHSMGQKLVIVGALDSLLPTGLSVVQKHQLYLDAIQVVLREEKIADQEAKILAETDEKKKARQIKALDNLKESPAKKGVIEPKYSNLYFPLKLFVVQKEIFPTMNLDLDAIMVKCSKGLDIVSGHPFPFVTKKGCPNDPMVKLVKGETLQKLDAMVLNSEAMEKATGKKGAMYLDYAAAGYVMEAKEFSYAKGEKKALKLVIDSSGYVAEKVIWPDREGKLSYPEELKKGCVATFFYSKKVDSEYVNLRQIVVEDTK